MPTGYLAETVIAARNTGTTPGSATPATVHEVDGRPLGLIDELRCRLNVTQALTGTVPTLNVYLQRAVAGDPDPTVAADWEDFYAFPQVTTSTVDLVVSLPLPAAQDVDGTLTTASRARAVETLTADTLLAGHWAGPIRVREVLGGTPTQAAIYDLELVGR
jgi:hypothetical protein